MSSGVDAVSARFSSRFVFVTLLPNVVIIAIVTTVVAAGAPDGMPSLEHVGDSAKALDVWGWVALGLATVVGSVAMHSLQTPIIQFMEGYWSHLPYGDKLASAARRRFELEHERIGEVLFAGNADAATLARANERDRRMPRRADILPTELGNVLTKGEELSTSRYGVDVLFAFPRLMHVVPSEHLAPLMDRRTQLDTSARLSAAFMVSSVVSLGLLLPTGRWLWLPAACLILSWASYRSAVAAAKSFTDELQVIADLYHLDLWKALRLRVPEALAEELERGPSLLRMFRYGQITESQRRSLVWVESNEEANRGVAGDEKRP